MAEFQKTIIRLLGFYDKKAGHSLEYGWLVTVDLLKAKDIDIDKEEYRKEYQIGWENNEES